MIFAEEGNGLTGWRRLNYGVRYLAELGTNGYRGDDLAGLIVANLTGYLASFSSLSFAVSFSLHDFSSLRPLVIGNIVSAICTVATPCFHRFSRFAAAVWLTAIFLVSLFYFTSLLGRESGVILNLIGASAVAFAVLGLRHFKLVMVITLVSAWMVIYCWIKFPNAAPGIYDEPMFMQQIYATSIISIMGIIYVVIYYAFHLTAVANKQTDDILRSIMPAKIVDRLKDQPGVTIAEQFGSVPVLFADLVGFTELTNQLGPERIVDLLDELFSGFDELAAQFGVEKIKTIGDAYLAVCGVPVPHPDPEKRILIMANAMHHFAEVLGESHTLSLKLRIGVAKGPLTAGVVGKSKYFYDIWGPVVNLASRLQTAASPGETLISDPLKDSLAGQDRMVDCGTLDLKGFGCVQAWQVLRAEPSSINGDSLSLDRESRS